MSIINSYPFLHGSTSSLLPAQSTTSLPAYSRRPSTPPQSRTSRPKTEHIVELSNNSGMGGAASKKSKPWAVLKVYSNARSSKSLPTFVEGDKITGSVSLDLGGGSWMSGSSGSGDAISSVRIIVRGECSTGLGLSTEGHTFLETEIVLWSKDGQNARLSGEQHWPFSMSLPKQVFLSSLDKSEVPYSLPHTFLERHTRASIRYDLTVHVARSKLRSSSSLQQTFVYIPAIRPEPPSLLRQLAYQENSPLAGPSVDPEGWLTLESVKAYGTLFSSRPVEILCTLSLAKPLCYTRNSVLPLSLLLESSDSQALDLLTANPNSSINIRLRRQVQVWHTKSTVNAFTALPVYTTKDNFDIDLGEAIWWPSMTDQEGPVRERKERKRLRLDGEIPLAKDLKPSTLIPQVRVEYFVLLLPFTVTGFVPSPSPSSTPTPSFSSPENLSSSHTIHTKPSRANLTRPSTSPSSSGLPSRSVSYTAPSSMAGQATLSLPVRSASFTPRPNTSPLPTSHWSLYPSHHNSHGNASGDMVKPLLAQPVKIATVFAKGPRPISGRPDSIPSSHRNGHRDHRSNANGHPLGEQGRSQGGDSLPPEYEDNFA